MKRRALVTGNCIKKPSVIPSCPECGNQMRYCYTEYSIDLYTCPRDGRRKYVVSSKA